MRSSCAVDSFLVRAAVTLAASALVAAAMWLLTPVSSTIRYRAEDISGGQDASAELRTELNRGSIDVWKTAPVTGVGLGNSRSNLDQIDVSWAPPGASVAFNSANAYLNLLGEAGPVAVGALGGPAPRPVVEKPTCTAEARGAHPFLHRPLSRFSSSSSTR